jgi:hypothetical protein
MSKPFLIVNVVDGKLGVIKERPTWEEALDCAAELAAEQCDTPIDAIRIELDSDTNFINENGDITVYIWPG